MKKLTILFVIIISFQSFGQTPTDTSTDGKVNFYLNKINDKTLTDKDKKELVKLIFGIQNKGFILEEGSRDYKGSFVQIDKALSLWIALKDTTNEANLRKYEGLLLGHLGKFPEAKAEIHKAIELYKLKKMDFGIAVSQFDLSRVYEYESKLDSALYFAQTALAYWKTQSDTGRIMLIRNQLINLYCKSKEYSKAEEIQKGSQPMSDNKDLHWYPVIDFYFLSYQLYEKLGKNDIANSYKKLYSDKIASLKKEGIDTRSSYDTQ